ncbi:MAG: flagellar basal body rod protein FlgB [Actinomycetota bacterium]|nr:flagellar basal body rod protein FlgB [Actinomycetota bacterium]
MLDRIFSDEPFMVLKNSLKAASKRQEVISNNIANVNTPGFKKSDVVFEDALKGAIASSSGSKKLTRTDPKHMAGAASSPAGEVTVKEFTINETSMALNGNNVDIDDEMSKLAKNGLYYTALSDLMKRRFESLKSVLK